VRTPLGCRTRRRRHRLCAIAPLPLTSTGPCALAFLPRASLAPSAAGTRCRTLAMGDASVSYLRRLRALPPPRPTSPDPPPPPMSVSCPVRRRSPWRLGFPPPFPLPRRLGFPALWCAWHGRWWHCGVLSRLLRSSIEPQHPSLD